MLFVIVMINYELSITLANRGSFVILFFYLSVSCTRFDHFINQDSVSMRSVVMFTLGRKIDFRYKSNLIIVLFSFIVTALGRFATGEVLSGIYLGGGVFLTWALSRELDPAHDYSAFIAAALSLSMLFDFETTQLFIVLWLLLLMRAMSGITGKELTLFDVVTLLIFTVFLSLNNENGIYLLIFVLAMAFILRAGETIKAIATAGALGFVFFIFQSFLMNPLSFNRTDYFNVSTLLMIMLSGLYLIVFWFLSRIQTEDDKGNTAVRSKVFANQLLYSVAVLLLFFFGDMTFNDQIIYLSAITGVTFHFIAVKFIETK